MEIWRASRTESVNQSQRLHRSIEDAGGVASLTDLCIHSNASAERSIGRSSPHKLGSPAAARSAHNRNHCSDVDPSNTCALNSLALNQLLL